MRKAPSASPSLVSHGRVASCVRGCKVPAPAHPVSHSPPSGSLPTGLVGRPFAFPSVAPPSQPAPALTPALAPALVAPSCAGLSAVVTNWLGESTGSVVGASPWLQTHPARHAAPHSARPLACFGSHLKMISPAGLIAPILANVEARIRAGEAGPRDSQVHTLSQTLVAEDRQRLAHLFKPFFHKYDQDSDGSLSADELNHLLVDLGEDISKKQARHGDTQTLSPVPVHTGPVPPGLHRLNSAPCTPTQRPLGQQSALTSRPPTCRTSSGWRGWTPIAQAPSS